MTNGHCQSHLCCSDFSAAATAANAAARGVDYSGRRIGASYVESLVSEETLAAIDGAGSSSAVLVSDLSHLPCHF